MLDLEEYHMMIHGFQTLTLLDYPGYTAAAIFLGGCNFRCPFCQNAGLVLHPETEPTIPTEEVLAFLKKRKRVLDGVCITGGEPTLEPELPELIAAIKDMGYLVKLDSNGSRPDILKSLCQQGLLDYVAMDIKSSPSGYGKSAGLIRPDLDSIRESVRFLMEGTVDYEFRTTVARELHDPEEFEEIGNWLFGCRRYYLQAYRDSDHILKPGCFSSYTRAELEGFADLLRKKIPLVDIRGID